jgi:hypothetical protein
VRMLMFRWHFFSLFYVLVLLVRLVFMRMYHLNFIYYRTLSEKVSLRPFLAWRSESRRGR